MKRIRLSNWLFLTGLILLLPIYPVFGSVLYDGSFRGALGDQVDDSTIIDTVTDYEDEDALSPGGNANPSRVWTGRKTIEYYTVQSGDTLDQLARDFSLTHNTIRWSNNLSSNILRVGQQLIIPPGDGIIYTTKQWDTLDAISRKYKVSTEKIRISNTIGDKISIDQVLFLPDAQQPIIIPESVRTGISGKYELKVINPKGAWFVPGQCTYFVAKHWPVKWRGNARAWFKNAKAAWFKTWQTARPWSIVVWYGPGYNLTYGHVGIVMSVDSKKWTMIIKDMNYTGPWKITTREEKIKNKYILGFIYQP